MSNMNFVIAGVIQFVSGTMTIFSEGDGTKIRSKQSSQFSEFGCRTTKFGIFSILGDMTSQTNPSHEGNKSLN